MITRQVETSIGGLLGILARDTGVLVRQELQLATTEMAATAKSAAGNVALIAAGGLLVQAGVFALSVAVMVGLEPVIPIWLSAIILGVVLMGTGYAVVQKGLNALQRLDLTPQETIRTLTADVVWAKEQWQ